jgi:ABC-type transport system involved in cytochrome c biogenesis permease subunit
MSLENLLPLLAVPALALAWLSQIWRGRWQFWVLPLLWLAVILLAWGLGLRWLRLGHGPFFNLYEILASNLFSLSLIHALFYWRQPQWRASSSVVLPVLLLLGGWLWHSTPSDSHFHPTYDTAWLWVHLAAGKLFLGMTLCALGVALLSPLRQVFPVAFAGTPDSPALEGQTWRLLRWALVFETGMLAAGSVWAQDAWGRYWAWDPLETWAFLTWLALVAALHIRHSYRISPGLTAGMVAGVFILAFLTFFGVPFISLAPHKGAI